jgi:hypothetical protein
VKLGVIVSGCWTIRTPHPLLSKFQLSENSEANFFLMTYLSISNNITDHKRIPSLRISQKEVSLTTREGIHV